VGHAQWPNIPPLKFFFLACLAVLELDGVALEEI
jgi:hypothetical protein